MSHDACFEAVLHEGATHGKLSSINGIETYVAVPSGTYDKRVALLIFTDVFGIALNNNKLLADSFAHNGFQVFMPDYLAGDAAPSDASKWKDKPQWFARHEASTTVPVLEKVIDGLKAQGIRTFVAVGYCFGAREVVKYAVDGTLKAAAVAHPSRLEYPTDLRQERLKQAGTPILFNAAEKDEAFGPEQQKMADEILGPETFYKRTFHRGCSHGFAVRGDMSDPLVKQGKDEAFRAQVDWFRRYL